MVLGRSQARTNPEAPRGAKGTNLSRDKVREHLKVKRQFLILYFDNSDSVFFSYNYIYIYKGYGLRTLYRLTPAMVH